MVHLIAHHKHEIDMLEGMIECIYDRYFLFGEVWSAEERKRCLSLSKMIPSKIPHGDLVPPPQALGAMQAVGSKPTLLMIRV